MRRGVSLLEVMFAIVVTTIGLLGALALLPVASSQAKKGRVNDVVAVLAPTAVHEFDTRGWRQTANWRAWNPVAGAWQPYAPQFGESICIDPRFIAANQATPVPASVFPHITAGAGEVRMRRLTLNRGDGLPMSNLLADSLFVFGDDLVYDRPDDNSLTPVQKWDGTNRRQTAGEYSWLATLAPKIDRYSTSLNKYYVLSVVIFHQRPGLELSSNSERVCDVAFPGSGIGGGEVLLSSTNGTSLAVKSGDWAMLMGRSQQMVVDQASGRLSLPVPRFQWYRVADAEPEDDAGQRYATLIGQDWDATATSPQALLMSGVVAVHERTVTLE